MLVLSSLFLFRLWLLKGQDLSYHLLSFTADALQIPAFKQEDTLYHTEPLNTEMSQMSQPQYVQNQTHDV